MSEWMKRFLEEEEARQAAVYDRWQKWLDQSPPLPPGKTVTFRIVRGDADA